MLEFCVFRFERDLICLSVCLSVFIDRSVCMYVGR